MRYNFKSIIIIIFIMLSPLSTMAEYSFSNNPSAVEAAADSVLMIEVYNDDLELVATGSGFVAFEECMVVTNYHVIEHGSHFLSVSDDGVAYELGYIYMSDKDKDLVLMGFLNKNDIIPLEINLTDKILRGDAIVAIGSPIGITNTVSIGNVSAVYSDQGVQYIQFTAPVSNGSSGGVLLNDKGQVIGVTSASYIDVQNINLAIDIIEVQHLYEQWDGVSYTKVGTFSVKKEPRIYKMLTEDEVSGATESKAVFLLCKKLFEYGYIPHEPSFSIRGGYLQEFLNDNPECVLIYEYGIIYDPISEELQEFIFEGMPNTRQEPLIAVRMSKDARAEYSISDNSLEISIELTNISPTRTVSSVLLQIYIKDGSNQKTDSAFYASDVIILPQTTNNTDYISIPINKEVLLMNNEDNNIIQLNCAVKAITYDDGTTYEVPSSDLEYDKFNITIY